MGPTGEYLYDLKVHGGLPYYGGRVGLMESWVRTVPLEHKEVGEAPGSSPLQTYLDIDLSDIDKLKKEFSPVEVDRDLRRGPPVPLSFVVEQEQVYVGQAVNRDPRNGQPMLISFKLFIEKLTSENP